MVAALRPPRLLALADVCATPSWDDVSLRRLVEVSLKGDQIIAVSNRQPVANQSTNDVREETVPASGLVTAVEPVMLACRGTWVAYGAGRADRSVVNARNGIMIHRGGGHYRLRRVWIDPQHQSGHRDGFSNAGLWPLCHHVQVRPVLDDADWAAYREVNQRFADAVVDEATQSDPIVLVQDYHLALVPQMVRRRLPQATIVTFWHIPWAHVDQMGICPWLGDLIKGLTCSDLLGFQTPADSRHFNAAARWSGLQVAGDGHVVAGDHELRVRVYPISIAWPMKSVAGDAVLQLQRPLRPSAMKLIVGIDRMDYTKGLLERVRAIECLLDEYPQWVGRVRLLQVAAPSREALHEYAEFGARLKREVGRINARFAARGQAPIVLFDRVHTREQVQTLYREADVCLVTSLHDGMNLVCKEFIAARNDEQGVLVLSEFAGAAQELTHALIVNPYHPSRVGSALHQALTMPPTEQRGRMRALRATVRERNVFRWAGQMVREAAELRAPVSGMAGLAAGGDGPRRSAC